MIARLIGASARNPFGKVSRLYALRWRDGGAAY